MAKSKYSKEELEIIEQIESGKFQSVNNLSEMKNKYRAYAKHTLKKEKRVNIRISERDLTSIQRKAVEEGIPYQTLISSLLHKYINGNLIDRNTLKQVKQL